MSNPAIGLEQLRDRGGTNIPIRHKGGALFRRRDWFGQIIKGVVDEWLDVTNIR